MVNFPIVEEVKMISAGIVSKMVQTDSQTAAALIGVGGSITALSALTYASCAINCDLLRRSTEQSYKRK